MEAEDPRHKKLDESISVSDAVPRGVADSHISPRSRGAALCVRTKGVGERHLRRPAGERAEDHMTLVQFDNICLSSVNE